MDLTEVRRLVIIAMFSDDVLLERLVLKGGNAINIVYGFGSRTSIDIDFSIDGDFEDVGDIRNRIFDALSDRFRTVGYTVFDMTFEKRPATGGGNQWGGYQAEFKIIETAKYTELGGKLEAIRRNAAVTAPRQQRTFRIEISKHEFCEGKRETEVDRFTVYVYTPSMLAIEKLRAICQQMPEYPARIKKVARARDFYDLYILVTAAAVDLSSAENHTLAVNIFGAKSVDLRLLAKIKDTREFHRPDWPSVQDSVVEKLEGFDFYFDYVIKELQKLKPLWNI